MNMVWTGANKVFCVLELVQTVSIVAVQWRFQTKYHTEPPMDKKKRFVIYHLLLGNDDISSYTTAIAE
jgi:hypothetical protein